MLGDNTDPHERTLTPVEHMPPSPRLSDTFVGRVLVQGVALLGVAALVTTIVDERSAETSARLSHLESELEMVRHERDRMQRLSEELTTELSDAAIEAEIVRWQLSYTEERYSRLRAVHSRANAEGRPHEAPPERTGPTPTPGPPAVFASLDPVHGTPPDAPSDEAPSSPPAMAVVAVAVGSDTVTDATPVSSPGAAMRPLLELEMIDGSGAPPSVRHLDSQLDRDRAFRIWQDVMAESADRECSRRTGAAERRCRSRIKRTLIPVGGRAVECILSGNASADYVADIPLDQLPTHSVPLEKGAVILCDRGLHNL